MNAKDSRALILSTCKTVPEVMALHNPPQGPPLKLDVFMEELQKAWRSSRSQKSPPLGSKENTDEFTDRMIASSSPTTFDAVAVAEEHEDGGEDPPSVASSSSDGANLHQPVAIAGANLQQSVASPPSGAFQVPHQSIDADAVTKEEPRKCVLIKDAIT